MEPAEIDWKNIDSQYERDEVYEQINAPKWLDLSAPDALSVDDVAWFCRPDCLHPVMAEDFNRPKVKLVRSNSKLIPLSGEQKSDHRDAYLRRKGRIGNFFPSPIKPKLNSKKFSEDLENQNPNREANLPATKEKKAAVAKKEAVKSSAEKKQGDADEEVIEESQSKRTFKDQPMLKSVFSARNLFSGKDILSQISEFCHELKKFATGKDSAVTEEEEKMKNTEKVKEIASLTENMEEEKKAPVSTKKNGRLMKRCELSLKLESNEEKSKILKEPRAFPPTPQRFPSPSGHRHLPASKASVNSNSPLGRLPKSKTPERGVLQEMDQRRREETRELIPKNEECNNYSNTSVVEGSAVDLFWFLKPCSYLVD